MPWRRYASRWTSACCGAARRVTRVALVRVSSKLDEDSYISEHVRQELCGRLKSKTVRASLLGGGLLFILAVMYTIHLSTARYGARACRARKRRSAPAGNVPCAEARLARPAVTLPSVLRASVSRRHVAGSPCPAAARRGARARGANAAQGLISAASLCAEDGDLFNPESRMCKMENHIAFAAMALQVLPNVLGLAKKVCETPKTPKTEDRLPALPRKRNSKNAWVRRTDCPEPTRRGGVGCGENAWAAGKAPQPTLNTAELGAR